MNTEVARMGDGVRSGEQDYAVDRKRELDRPAFLLAKEMQVGRAELARVREDRYSVFAEVVRPAVALAGGAVLAHYVYNNPGIVVDVLGFIFEYVPGYQIAVALSKTLGDNFMVGIAGIGGIIGYGISSLLGPAVIYGVLRLISGISYVAKEILYMPFRVGIFLVKTVYWVLKGIVNLLMGIAKGIYNYRNILLSLLILGLVVYYDPRISGAVLGGLG